MWFAGIIPAPLCSAEVLRRREVEGDHDATRRVIIERYGVTVPEQPLSPCATAHHAPPSARLSDSHSTLVHQWQHVIPCTQRTSHHKEEGSTNNRPFCRTDLLSDGEMGCSFDFPCLNCTPLSLKNWVCSLEKKTSEYRTPQTRLGRAAPLRITSGDAYAVNNTALCYSPLREDERTPGSGDSSTTGTPSYRLVCLLQALSPTRGDPSPWRKDTPI